MRKHTKTVFWFIIILIVPAFIFFWVPQYFRQGGPRSKYGSVFGKAVTTDGFGDAYRAESHLLQHIIVAMRGMSYRLPRNRALGTMREALLAEFSRDFDATTEWRDRPFVRKELERAFTDPDTGRFDEAAYRKQWRELGMTEEEFLDAFKSDLVMSGTVLSRLFDVDDTAAQDYLRRRVWRRLALAHEAERLRIPVSDQDVVNYLYFLFPGDDGRVDEERYGQVLRMLKRSRLDYENDLRTTVRIATLLQTVLDSAKAPAGEADEEFDDMYRTFKLAYHLEPYAPYANPSALRPDEVIAWYMTNRTNADVLKIEPRVAVLYVLVEGKAFEGDIEVEDQDLKDYYDAHRAEFADASGEAQPYEACPPAVRDAVRAAVVERKAMARAADEATTLFAVTRTSDRLIGAVEQANADAAGQGTARRYELRATPLFGPEGPIDDTIGEDEENFRNAAFALELSEVAAGPVRVKQGWCVLAPTRIEPDPTPGAKNTWPFYMVRGEARRGAAIDRVKPEILEVLREQYTEVRRLMDDEGLGFIAACEHEEIALTTTTRFVGIEDEKVAGLDDGRQLILTASQDRQARKQIDEGLIEPEQHYVYEADEGAVLFDIVESRAPSAAFRAREMPWFAARVARRGYEGEVYREWIEALEARATVVDLAQQALEQQRLLEQQQQQQQQGRGVAR